MESPVFSSAPAMGESPASSLSSLVSTTSTSAPVTTTIYLSTYTTAATYTSPSSLSGLSSSAMMPGYPIVSASSSAIGSLSSTLLTSVTTSLPNPVTPPAPTTTPTYWGWACNSTNGTLPEQYSSQSGAGCSETFVVPSSTKININLTEPTATGSDKTSEPTRTFTPGVFPGAAPRGVDLSYGGVVGWAGLMAVVGFWIGLI